MKKMTRALSLFLVALMIASMLGTALADELAQDTPLASFDGQPVTLADVQSALNSLVSNGYIYDETDYETALDYLLRDMTLDAQVKKMGLDQFTAEEEEAFLAEAQTEWDQAVQTYVDYFLADDTEEARAQAYADGEAYFHAYGYSVEALADDLKRTASYDLLEEKLLEGQDVSVTAEEIKAVFDDYVEQHRQQYENNVLLYEMYQNYYGADSWYIPEGYRGIIHILMTVDEDVLAAYQDAQAAYEESITEENPDGDPALLTARDQALTAVLAAKQPQIDDIYARLAIGESFESLIAIYGEDPGMTDAATLQEGYPVHQDSIVWDPAFTAGAFSEKMRQPGDTSDPIVGSYGIHILHYLRDIPGGPVEMTDEISSTIEEYLSGQKTSQIFDDALSAWMDSHEITYDQDAITAAKAQASAVEEE